MRDCAAKGKDEEDASRVVQVASCDAIQGSHFAATQCAGNRRRILPSTAHQSQSTSEAADLPSRHGRHQEHGTRHQAQQGPSRAPSSARAAFYGLTQGMRIHFLSVRSQLSRAATASQHATNGERAAERVACTLRLDEGDASRCALDAAEDWASRAAN